MIKFFRSSTGAIFVLSVVFFVNVFIQAQDSPPPPPPPAPRMGVATRIGSYNAESDEDEKKGSIVRGRAFYQDTTNPVRRGWIGLKKIRELTEKTDGDGSVAVAARIYSAEKYVLTNDNGEFVIRSIKAGIYQPVFKIAGILNNNNNSIDAEYPLYQSIAIDGISEISVQVAVKRGGSVSGRASYFDGTPVIGAKVQIVSKKAEQRFVSYGGADNTSDTTDDRGFYHFAGLPDGEYLVRVTEPSIHNEENNSVQGYNISAQAYGSILTTFYPNVSKTEEAIVVKVVAGQEQTEINISIPDRRLFRISGTVIAQNSKTAVKDLKVTFQKTDGEQIYNYYDQSKQAKTDEQGKWAFVDLPKGKYLIKVSSETDRNYAKPATKPDVQPKFAIVSREIEIDNENIQNVILEMTPESAISGTVIVEGGKEFPQFAFFRVFDEQNKAESSASLSNYDAKNNPLTNSAPRNFRIGELPAGKYNFTANVSDQFYVKSARSGAVDLLNSPVEIGAGVEISDVRVVLAADVGILKGKVNQFTATERTFVILLPVNRSGLSMLNNSGQGIVSKDGEFSIKAAPGEYYAVVVNNSNRPKDKKLSEWLDTLIADAPKVTLKAKETTNTTLDLPKK